MRRVQLHQELPVGKEIYQLYLEKDYELAWWGWILKDGKMFPPGASKKRFYMQFETDEQAEKRAKAEMHHLLFSQLKKQHSCNTSCESWLRTEM